MHLPPLVLVPLLILAQAPADATRIAVFDFATTGLAEAEAKALDATLVGLVAAEAQTLGYGVVSSADLSAMLSLEKQEDLLACEDNTSCLSEIGGALGVDLLVAGTVSKVGET
jgi:hypothetical protein